MADLAERARNRLDSAPVGVRLGRVVSCNGLVIEGFGPDLRLGETCVLERSDEGPLLCQAIGFRAGHILLMPFGATAGIKVGDRLRASDKPLSIPVGERLIGRVMDAFGRPLDGRGALHVLHHTPVHRAPIPALAREDNDAVLESGVLAIDALLTLGQGQRVGVFAGSGVGKSTLLGMMTRHVRADVTVIGLVGERGREVVDFVNGVLGEDGMARAVVVAATSDEPALVRVHATHAAHAIAEHFRDEGKNVLLVIDSITRYAMAQREVGLAAGEPPTSRGYPPSVFNALPRLVERGGNLRGKGSLSCVYSVLVEGDDMNDPVADHMRALLDGHIVLSRQMANRGQLPAIDVLQSVSRWLSRVTTPEERKLAERVRKILALYEASRDLIDMGAHQKGANSELDRAVELAPRIYELLIQLPDEGRSREEGHGALASLIREATP